MITVWGRRSSSNVQAVMWCIQELGLSYERIDAGFTYGVIETEQYKAMNPNGTVPTIQDGNNPPLWETGAILRYLASQYSTTRFWPDDPCERAIVDQWAEWSKLNIALRFTSPIFWQVVRTPVVRQDPVAIKNAVMAFESALSIADRQLQIHPYLAGPNFSLADIQFAHVLFRYYHISIDRAPLEALAQYYQRISSRKPFIQHVALPYSELVHTI